MRERLHLYFVGARERVLREFRGVVVRVGATFRALENRASEYRTRANARRNALAAEWDLRIDEFGALYKTVKSAIVAELRDWIPPAWFAVTMGAIAVAIFAIMVGSDISGAAEDRKFFARQTTGDEARDETMRCIAESIDHLYTGPDKGRLAASAQSCLEVRRLPPR